MDVQSPSHLLSIPSISSRPCHVFRADAPSTVISGEPKKGFALGSIHPIVGSFPRSPIPFGNPAMYLEYYGLKEAPFSVTPDPKFLFMSDQHEEALAHLRYGIEQRKGFIVLSGEVGCGKTTLCRQILNELDHARYDTALILNPRMDEEELLRSILVELGLQPVQGGKSALMHQLNEHCLRRIHEGKDIVLIIDESQNLSSDALEHVRLLSNLETDTRKLLQIVLLGQPELKERLMRREFRQLRQRILVFYELNPMTFEEMRHYVQHRLQVSGANARPRFTLPALLRLHWFAGGVPRMVNNICDKALLAAYVRQSDVVTFRDAGRAIRELTIS